MSEWEEVTKEAFFRGIGRQDVTPYPVGPWPYTSLFKTPHGEVRGKIVDYIPEDSGLTESRYFLPTQGDTTKGEAAAQKD
jgi:hypothetical protein